MCSMNEVLYMYRMLIIYSYDVRRNVCTSVYQLKTFESMKMSISVNNLCDYMIYEPS